MTFLNRILMLSLCALLWLSGAQLTFAENTTSLTLNIHGTVTAVQAIQTVSGDFLLPLRETIQALGGTVSNITESNSIAFSLNDQYMRYRTTSSTLTVGHTVQLNTTDFRMQDSRLYVRLSFLKKTFGIHYYYNGEALYLDVDGYGIDNLNIKPARIAHGGGRYLGMTVTNTYEAIQQSISNGFELIEVDFLRTTDGQYVLAHDWWSVSKYLTTQVGEKTYLEFMDLGNEKFTPIDLKKLIEILVRHPQVKIVTDTKSDNIELLTTIAEMYPVYLNRIYPQIYDMETYETVRALGYENIVYTLYKTYKTDAQVLEFARENPLYAVTMAESRAGSGLAQKLSDLGVMTYVHTVNTLEGVDYYENLGVQGVYSDDLY